MVLVGRSPGRTWRLRRGEVNLSPRDPSAVAAYGPLFDAKRPAPFRSRPCMARGGSARPHRGRPHRRCRDGGAAEARRASSCSCRARPFAEASPMTGSSTLADLAGLAAAGAAGAGDRGAEPRRRRSSPSRAVPGAPSISVSPKAFVPVVDLAAGRIVADLPDDFFTCRCGTKPPTRTPARRRR